MNDFERFGLMLSLAVFFGFLALSMMNMYKKADKNTPYTSAYMAAGSSSKNLPQSVLSYPSLDEIEKMSRNKTIACYIDDQYDKLIATRKEDLGVKLVASAALRQDQLEIYAADDGAFFAIVKGPDALGKTEACEVAVGKEWHIHK